MVGLFCVLVLFLIKIHLLIKFALEPRYFYFSLSPYWSCRCTRGVSEFHGIVLCTCSNNGSYNQCMYMCETGCSSSLHTLVVAGAHEGKERSTMEHILSRIHGYLVCWLIHL